MYRVSKCLFLVKTPAYYRVRTRVFDVPFLKTIRLGATNAFALQCSVMSQSSPKGEIAQIPKKHIPLYVLCSVKSRSDQYATKWDNTLQRQYATKIKLRVKKQ